MRKPFYLTFSLILIAGLGFSQTIVIGKQIWMTENLAVTRFKNGDSIPQAQSDEEWQKAGFGKKPAWCYVTVGEMGNPQPEKKYGILYNSYAINDPRGLVPDGWRISKTDDWRELEQHLKSTGISLKGILSVSGWTRGSGNNKSRLNIQPGGWRDVGCGGVGNSITFWCEKVIDDDMSEKISTRTFSLNQYSDGNIGSQYNETNWIMGHYVRCVKDKKQ